MRILQLIQKPQLRGAEVFACQLANALVNNGHEVKVVAIFVGNAELPFTGKVLSLSRPLNKRMFDLAGWRMLAQLIQDFNPDIIQANAGDTLKVAALSKLIFRWKQPLVFRNASTMSTYIKSTGVRLFNGFLLQRARAVISVSENSKQDLLRLFPKRDAASVYVVPIGVEETSLIQVQQDKPAETPIVIHVGGFTFEKNHSGLLRIMEPVLAANPDLKLVLVGDGPLRSKIEDQAKALKVSAQIQFLGYRQDALAIMRSAQVLVLPSIIEGLPGVILEAYSQQVPVIAYNVGGIREVLTDQQTGWLVAAGDEAGFRLALEQALKHPDKRKLFANNGFKLVKHQFTNSAIANRFESIYMSLIGRNS